MSDRACISALVFGLSAVSLSCTSVQGGNEAEYLYAARRSVEVRAALAPDSPTETQLALHDRVRVLRRRRSLALVVAEDGAQGWVRQSEMISPDYFEHADRLAAFVAPFPSQGVRRTFDALNVHIQPARDAPTIYQLSAEEPVELLRSRTVAAPADSGEIARRRSEAWYLVRAKIGPVGWVLASRLYADIPVELAQYAEGRRIVAFFQLDERPHPTWLWTQLGENGPYDYDRFRVSRWNAARSTYQTVGMARGLKGLLPVEAHAWVDSDEGSGPGFSLRLVRDDGEEVARTYSLARGRVHRVSEREAAPIPSVPDNFDPPSPEQATEDSWFGQWRGRLSDLLQQFSL